MGKHSSEALGENSGLSSASSANSMPNLSTKDTVEYSIESTSLQNYRARQRRDTQNIAALGQYLKEGESYLPKMVTSEENSSLTTTSTQTDPDNSPADNSKVSFSSAPKPQ